MIDREFVEKLEELVLKANKIETTKEEASGVYFIRQPDGRLEKMRALLDPCSATLYTITDFARAVAAEKRHLEGQIYIGKEKSLGNTPTIVAVAVFSDAHTCWRFTLPIPEHPTYRYLKEIDNREFNHKSFVKMLKTKLHDYISTAVIENIRNIKVTSVTQSASGLGQGNKNIDLSIRQEARSKNDASIPDRFEWCLPIYGLPELLEESSQTMVVLLDVEAGETVNDVTFTLSILPDELIMAEQDALTKVKVLIENALKQHDCAIEVFQGHR